jgi:Tfp pilus assembly protein PilE
MLKYLNPSYYLHTSKRDGQRVGYTIDQTILIVVIIAILITLVIVTVGWQLINRTSGTKVASQFTQMEDAISQFYGATRRWPHLAFTTAPTNPATGNALILAGVTPAGAVVNATIPATALVNNVPGLTINGTTSLRNLYGGDISMVNGSVNNWTGAPATSDYILVEFAGVPITDAQEADRAIDPIADFDDGRFVYSTASCLPAAGDAAANSLGAEPTAGNVFACFVASAIN